MNYGSPTILHIRYSGDLGDFGVQIRPTPTPFLSHDSNFRAWVEEFLNVLKYGIVVTENSGGCELSFTICNIITLERLDTRQYETNIVVNLARKH